MGPLPDGIEEICIMRARGENNMSVKVPFFYLCQDPLSISPLSVMFLSLSLRLNDCLFFLYCHFVFCIRPCKNSYNKFKCELSVLIFWTNGTHTEKKLVYLGHPNHGVIFFSFVNSRHTHHDVWCLTRIIQKTKTIFNLHNYGLGFFFLTCVMPAFFGDII